MTDIRISDILEAGERLQKTIDPEGMLANGSITRITHRLSDDGRGFSWKSDVTFMSEDVLKLHGQYHEDIGFLLNRCVIMSGRERHDIRLKPAETLATALEELHRLPVCLRRNLARISLKTGKEGKPDIQYDMNIYKTATDALFWNVEGGDEKDRERSMFRETTLLMKRDSNGFFTNTTIIGNCPTKNGSIKVRVSVDVYGLSSQAVTVEKNFNDKNEISAYCYSEDTSGRKIPSLMLAFRIDRMLTGKDDIREHVQRNSIELPNGERESQEESPNASRQSDEEQKEPVIQPKAYRH